MKLSKVLILHKKSTYQIQAMEHRESRFLKLLEEGNEVVTRVKTAHSEHLETLERVQLELSKRSIEFKSVARADLTSRVEGVDLMISVGGDGTFLDASHHLADVPLLGVNSSSSSSFGHFCLANDDNFAEIIDKIQNDTLKPEQLLRLDLTLNGSLLPEPVLNEVLIAHSNPAATSRCFIELDGVREEQRSSGIWVGTPSGSTGSLRSAGGVVMPIIDTRFQYIVREACMRPGEKWTLLRGVLDKDRQIKIVSQMRTGALYLDGQHIDYHFGLGDELKIKPSAKSLIAYVNQDVNDIFVK